jgi:hypothetical protein
MDFKLIIMKKAILFSLFTLLMLFTKAQGNLQFYRVKTLTGYVPGATSISLDTVPAGKVWKIESLGMSPLVVIINGAACTETFFAINGVEYLNHAQRVNSPYLVVLGHENIWLKAGDRIGYVYRSLGGNCNTNQPYVISIIEYNIIP